MSLILFLSLPPTAMMMDFVINNVVQLLIKSTDTRSLKVSFCRS